MLGELFKHKSLTKISNKFASRLRNKYSHINMGQYMIERLMNENINIGFCQDRFQDHKIFEISKKYKKFDLVFDESEQMTVDCALTYSKIFKRPGVIITSCEYGFQNISIPLYKSCIEGHPMLLIVLSESPSTKPTTIINNFLKDSHEVHDTYRFPQLFEYMLNIAQTSKPAPTCLNIQDNLITALIDLTVVGYYPISKRKSLVKNPNLLDSH